jgi:hypothetical protein
MFRDQLIISKSGTPDFECAVSKHGQMHLPLPPFETRLSALLWATGVAASRGHIPGREGDPGSRADADAPGSRIALRASGNVGLTFKANADR